MLSLAPRRRRRGHERRWLRTFRVVRLLRRPRVWGRQWEDRRGSGDAALRVVRGLRLPEGPGPRDQLSGGLELLARPEPHELAGSGLRHWRQLQERGGRHPPHPPRPGPPPPPAREV